MEGFIVYPSYRVFENKAFVYLFCRSTTGKAFLTVNHFRPYFFIKGDDLEKAKKLSSKFSYEKTKLKDFHGNKIIKIIVGVPKEVAKLRQLFLDNEIICYEADIRFSYRFLIDKGLKATLAAGKKNGASDRLEKALKEKGYNITELIYEPEILPGTIADSTKVKLSILSIDIETRKDSEILSISLYSDSLKAVIMSKNKGQAYLNSAAENKTGIAKTKKADNKGSSNPGKSILANNHCLGNELRLKDKLIKEKITIKTKAESFELLYVESEKDLLILFKELIWKLNPDVIIGWNIIDFDIAVLKQRFKKYKLGFNLGRTEDECKLNIQHDFFRSSSADFPGRVVLDGIDMLKLSFIALPDYRLETAAKELIADAKINLFGNENSGKEIKAKKKEKCAQIESLHKKKPEELASYNFHDSYLVYKIFEKKKLIDLAIERSFVTGLPLDKVKGSIAALDMLYLRKARHYGYVCPSAKYHQRTEKVKGAYVMRPKPGIYDYVLVFDFKSLYPSIIRTFNIDPLAFAIESKSYIEAPNGAKFSRDVAILPEIIKEILELRDKAKKKGNKAKSQALKIIMNSFYGVLANPNCRFYSLDLANAITSFARKIIKECAKEIKNQGYEAIYGDTDSVFVVSKASSVKEAMEIGDKLQQHINSYFKEMIRKEYSLDSCLVLEFEKIYIRLILPFIRGSTEQQGAKKRYAGLLVLPDELSKAEATEKAGTEESLLLKNAKIDIVGLEFVRRDWTDLAKEFQLELLKRVFERKDVASYIKEVMKELKQGKLDNLLVYRKAIRKELKDYTKTTPPHVKAARMLDSLDSNIIEYYITLNGPEPVQKLKSKIDYGHYLEKQLKPIAESILALFGKSFDDIIKGSSQKSLSEF